MSIILLEGFDLYGADDNHDVQQGLASRADIWAENFGVIESANGALLPHDGGNAMYFSSGTATSAPNALLTKDGLVSTEKAAAGIAFRSDRFAYYGLDDGPVVLGLCGARDYTSFTNGRIQARLEADTTTDTFKINFKIYEGSDLTASYYHTVSGLSHDIWHFLELEYSGEPGDTYARAALNGNLVVDQPLVSSDALLIQGVGFSGAYRNTGVNKIWYDHLYFLDLNDPAHGAAFQQRLGPIRIRPIPFAGDSTPSNWTASSAGAKYADVDEVPGPNDLDSTYISVDNAPQSQMFSRTPVDDTHPVLALTHFAAVKQDDPTVGVASLAFVADDGTEQEDVNPLPLQNSYRLLAHNYVVMPNGSPLTAAAITAAKWGVRSIQGS